ncbi:MAG: hemerythrin domain-containing protein [bacterium]
MKSLTIIKNEHRSLGAVLYCLKQLVSAVDGGKQPDFRVFHGLLMYIDRFLDRYHHPKENKYLFPAVLNRNPDLAATIELLGKQHREGEQMFIKVLKALSAYEYHGQPAFEEFKQAVSEYTTFEFEHAQKEESEILPVAESTLSKEDWQLIDAAFLDHHDPMFGDKPTAEFSALHRQIVSIIPAPLGLGSAWE